MTHARLRALAAATVAGSLFLMTGEKTVLSSEPIGTIDGVEVDGRGGYILTNVLEGQVVHVAPSGEVRVLMNFGDDVSGLLE